MSNAADESSSSFCILPWIHLNLNPDGAVTLCCQSHHAVRDEQGRPLNAQTHGLQEIWNSDGMRDIRRRMAAGERLPHCDACFHNESYRRASYRTHSNERWLTLRPAGLSLKEAIDRSEDGVAAWSPMYFDLRLGNVCNLKCTVCKPLYSSQIERDPVHAKWIVDAPYQRLSNRFGTEGEWFDADAILDEIIQLSGNLELIQLAGGEPTINKTQIGLLQALCNTGRAQDIDLEVVTNLSNVRQGVFDLFARFKSLRVGLSIDGAHATYEYVRYPGKWAQLVKNVARLRETRPGVRIQINAVLQALNAFNLVDLLDWADTEDIPINISIGRGLDHYNDFRILPRPMRDEFRARFDRFFARKRNRDMRAVQQNLHAILAEVADTDFSEEVRRDRVRDFMHFVNDMDRSRRLSFRTAQPDIYDGVVAYYGGWEQDTRYA